MDIVEIVMYVSGFLFLGWYKYWYIFIDWEHKSFEGGKKFLGWYVDCIILAFLGLLLLITAFLSLDHWIYYLDMVLLTVVTFSIITNYWKKRK